MILTRKQAKEQGSKHYFTGLPCVRGHIDYRFTSIGKCMACAREDAMKQHTHTTTKRRKYSDQDSFLSAVAGRHYDYSKVVYVNAKTPVEIVCEVHGSFWQAPANHIGGQGCPLCASAAVGARCKKNTKDFINDAVKIWGARFSYAKVEYDGAHVPVTITCKTHGDFEQTPTNHLFGRLGCPRCNHMKSKPEQEIADFLSLFTPVVQRDRSIIAPKELDIYLPEHNLAIEYCGMYWHTHKTWEDERKNRHRHAEKHRLCAAKGIRLITIYETEWLERPQTIRRLLRAATGNLRGKLMARKCDLQKVSHADAKAFYDKYHPQGGSGYGEHYGLYWKNALVACMRFTLGGNDRGRAAKDRQWTLSRYATRLSIAGAASRLFKAFVKEHQPESVKSFSDNRLFSGNMYEQLGFDLAETVGPDYQVWSPKIGLRPKPHYQRRNIQARLKDHGLSDAFDPNADPRTETEMTYLMGAARIYDCGKKRWQWNP